MERDDNGGNEFVSWYEMESNGSLDSSWQSWLGEESTQNDGQTIERTDGQKDERADGQTYEQMKGRTDEGTVRHERTNN